TRLKKQAFYADEVAKPAAAPETVANVERTVDLETALTLRSHVEKVLQRFAAASGDELRITFRPADQKTLNQSAISGRLEILPLTRSRLGKIPVQIKRLEGDIEVDRWTVEAQVAKRTLAVVVTDTIRRGDTFDASNVALREVMLDRDEELLIDDPAVVRGQSSKKSMREGDIVTAEHIKPPTVIHRGELVELRCIVNGLLVSQMGYAAEDAGLNEPVRVRVRTGSKRETVSAIATGRRRATIELSRPGGATND
ncbi:MAG: flagellar basal body P-ring formation chaperone FlgA, partial [Rhodospirillales bacterium]|nr:flagellar basal body P-ring formation chaperone FlgA [Rhodospirillales bacterium]